MTTHDDPLRLRFLKGMTAVLQTITPDNGYKTNLSNAVLRGRLTFGTKDPLPMVTILEPPIMPNNFPAPYATTAKDLPWNLIIQGFVQDDGEHPTDPAHVLLADVKQAMATEMLKLRTQTKGDVFGVQMNRLTKVVMDMGFVRPSDDLSSKAYFWLPVSVIFVEDWLTPYGD